MVFLYVQLDFTINILHFFCAKCLTGEKLSGNILEQLPRAIAKVLTTVEIIGNESNFVE